MSKYRFKSSCIYYDGTSIPRNKLNIQNAEEIHELENNLIEQSYDAFSSALNENTYNGYNPIDYSASVDNAAYIDASIACVQYVDSGLLEKIIFDGLVKWS